MAIPLIDLEPWFSGTARDRRQTAQAVDRHLQDVGFLLVTGHGIDERVLADARSAIAEFFALPRAAKEQYAFTGGPYRGWVGLGSESNAGAYGIDTPPDLKESFAVGRPDVSDALRRRSPTRHAPNIYPTEVAGFAEAADGFVLESMTLVRNLLALLEYALGVQPGTMVDLCREPMSSATYNWYLSLQALDAPLQPNQFRIGPHTDYGTITVLDRDQGLGGLQVLVDDTWVDAPWVDGALTINTGLLMQRWSNGRWTPNEHRVLPPPADDPAEELYSLVSFNSPDDDAVIRPLDACCSDTNPPRYEPVIAGDHLDAMLDALRVEA